MRAGQFSFSDAYAEVEGGQLYLNNLHISPFSKGTTGNHEPTRRRRLLAKKEEIRRLERQSREKGFTLIPLQFYLKRGWVKVLIGVCKGKKLHDKRQSIKERDLEREQRREERLP